MIGAYLLLTFAKFWEWPYWAAVIATLIGSIWPLVATGFASVDQAKDVIPFIQDLIARVRG